MRAIHQKKLKEFATISRPARSRLQDKGFAFIRSVKRRLPEIDGGRIESPQRGMKSPNRGKSWRLGRLGQLYWQWLWVRIASSAHSWVEDPSEARSALAAG